MKSHILFEKFAQNLKILELDEFVSLQKINK